MTSVMNAANIDPNNSYGNSFANAPEPPNSPVAKLSIEKVEHNLLRGSSLGGDDITSQISMGTDVKELHKMSAERIDWLLYHADNGVEHALDRAKAWSKYCERISNYAQRRMALEIKHAQDVKKLAEQVRDAIQEEYHLPMKTHYLKAFKFEAEFCEKCFDLKQQFDYKFVKPLDTRKLEHEKRRKEIKDRWQRHVKAVHDGEMQLDKARQTLNLKDGAFRKARDNAVKLELEAGDSTKIEKKRRVEEDAMIKRRDAEQECELLQRRLETRYQELEDAKVEIVRDLRELIYQCDQTTKACSATYFQILSQLWSCVPVSYQNLSDMARTYMPGSEFHYFVKQLPISAVDNTSPFILRRTKSDDDISLSSSIHRSESSSAISALSARFGFRTTPEPGLRSPGQQWMMSQHHAASVDHMDESPATAIPQFSSIKRRPERVTVGAWANPINQMPQDRKIRLRRLRRRHTLSSDAARTHMMQKVHLPTKCSNCASFTFFQTMQCSRCGLSCHKDCLDKLSIKCSENANIWMEAMALRRRMSVFGVPLAKQIEDSGLTVPPILQRCLEELDKKATRFKGLYRVSGVKSQTEQLCEQFERQGNGEDVVDLSNVHPTVLSSAVKLYLRQLPEPLLTFSLYPRFVDIAKRAASKTTDGIAAVPNYGSELKNVVSELPKPNHDTLKLLLLHFKRITWFESENQMTAANLGIVIGPNLLFSSECVDGGGASLSSLLDTPFQTKAVEMLITHAYEIFEVNPTEEFEKFQEFLAVHQSEHEPSPNLQLERTISGELQPSDVDSSGFGSSDGATNGLCNQSITPDLLKTRHVIEPSSPGSSSYEEAGSAGDVVSENMTEAIIQESLAIQQRFTNASSEDSRESSMAPSCADCQHKALKSTDDTNHRGRSNTSPLKFVKVSRDVQASVQDGGASNGTTTPTITVKSSPKFKQKIPFRRRKFIILRTKESEGGSFNPTAGNRPKSETFTHRKFDSLNCAEANWDMTGSEEDLLGQDVEETPVTAVLQLAKTVSEPTVRQNAKHVTTLRIEQEDGSDRSRL